MADLRETRSAFALGLVGFASFLPTVALVLWPATQPIATTGAASSSSPTPHGAQRVRPACVRPDRGGRSVAGLSPAGRVRRRPRVREPDGACPGAEPRAVPSISATPSPGTRPCCRWRPSPAPLAAGCSTPSAPRPRSGPRASASASRRCSFSASVPESRRPSVGRDVAPSPGRDLHSSAPPGHLRRRLARHGRRAARAGRRRSCRSSRRMSSASALGPRAYAFMPAVGAFSWRSSSRTVRSSTGRAGRRLLQTVAVFGAATIGFGLSRSLPLTLVLLAVMGAADMVSVVIRQTLVQADTPDELRGRVAAVNTLFIGASNELGEFESGDARRPGRRRPGRGDRGRRDNGCIAALVEAVSRTARSGPARAGGDAPEPGAFFVPRSRKFTQLIPLARRDVLAAGFHPGRGWRGVELPTSEQRLDEPPPRERKERAARCCERRSGRSCPHAGSIRRRFVRRQGLAGQSHALA